MTTEKVPMLARPLHEMETLDDYLRGFGQILGHKAVESMQPLHVPGNPETSQDFSDIEAFAPNRVPFPAQAEFISAGVQMFNNIGSGFGCGEMGTGKSIMGALITYKHGMQSRKQGGSGGKFRCLVLCPDHLIDKWRREIEQTIPGAAVTTFGPTITGESKGKKKKGKKKSGLKQEEFVPESATLATLRDMVIGVYGQSHRTEGSRKYWNKPTGPEYYVLGRNQAKWMPEWKGICETPEQSPLYKHVVSATETVLINGEYVKTKAFGRHYRCPSCGSVLRNEKGTPMSLKDLRRRTEEGKSQAGSSAKTCGGRYMQMVHNPEHPNSSGRDRISPILERYSGRKVGCEPFKHAGFMWTVKQCGEPLWNWTSRPKRWAPALIVQRKLRKFFKYLIVDEVHEHKSDESAQSMACGKLISSVDHVLALTGTIIGGYASHLYPLMMRITPQSLREEGYEWGKEMDFVKKYGRIDRIVKTKDEGHTTSQRGNVRSMRKAKGESKTDTKVTPGVMPGMYARHMLGSSIFITLEEMADELPNLYEYIGGPMPSLPDDVSDDEKEAWSDQERGWFDTACEMSYEQGAEYRRVMADIVAANKQLLQRGSIKFLSAQLWTGLDYPDKPFGWGHDPDLLKAYRGEGLDVKPSSPSLLGQTFLGRFDSHSGANGSLVLTKDGRTETIPMRKDGGVYEIDVTVNGEHVVPMIYDTGASDVSLSVEVASQVGITASKNDHAVRVGIADGSSHAAKSQTIKSLKVGSFTVSDVRCVVMPNGKLGHTIGYWDKPGVRTTDNWVGVVTPRDLPEETVYPKEQCLVDICLKQKEEGRQTWVYVQMTGKRNIQPRLKKLLESQGLKVGVMRSGDVEPIEREAWIAQHGREFDVMISHPQLVSTGLDLFSKEQGGHNYSTLVFFETGYNPFTMRQAARRAWRISQPLDCRVYYLYYKRTTQHQAMILMARKQAASQALEGEFSSEGLSAMAGDDNMQMALAKNLAAHVDDSDMQRSWGRIKSTKKPKPPGMTLVGSVAAIPPSPLDGLPIEIQIIAKDILEHQAPPLVELRPELPYVEVVGGIEGPLHPVRVEPAPPAPAPRAKRQPRKREPILRMPKIKPATNDDFESAFDGVQVPFFSEQDLANFFANMQSQ